MGLRDCLISAAEQNQISREEAAELADDFEVRFAQKRLSLSDEAAAASARQELEATLRGQAIEKKRAADLTEAARIRVKGRLLDYRTKTGDPDAHQSAMAIFSHYGFRDGASVRGRSEAIIAGAQAKMSEVMFALRRKGFFGRRNSQALETELMKELHGEASGS